MQILKNIVKHLHADYDFKEIVKKFESDDIFSLHFSICLYIRNEFLYNNPENFTILSQYFNTTCIDELSRKILNYAIFLFKNY